MKLFKKDQMLPIVIHEETKGIDEFQAIVKRTVKTLNEISKVIPLSDYESICNAKRNAKEIIDGIAIQKNPTLQAITENNPSFRIPWTSDLKKQFSQLESLDGYACKFALFNGREFVIDGKIEDEFNSRFRMTITRDDQKKRLDVATAIRDFLNSLSKSELQYFLNNHSDIRSLVSIGDPGTIRVDEQNEEQYRVNERFVFFELKEQVNDRPTVRPFNNIPDGDFISETSESKDYAPRKHKLLKDLSPRELQALEYESLVKQAWPSVKQA